LQLIPTSTDRSKSALAVDCPEADGPAAIEDQARDSVYERGSGLMATTPGCCCDC